MPKTKNANLLNCSVSMMLIMYPQTTTQNIQRHVTNKNEKKNLLGGIGSDRPSSVLPVAHGLSIF